MCGGCEGKNQNIEVSVICLAYNHEAYIRQALEGFAMQRTNFAFQVLVHDDASTDRTAEIIREYEKRYPDLIRPIYQNENQYSQGVNIGEVFLSQRIRGKYIALCEGDDYWVSPYKLQKEYDALEAHPEVDICAHSSWVLYPDGRKEESVVSDVDVLLSAGQIISGGGNFVKTNTIMYRLDLDQRIPEFRKNWDGDYTLKIHGSLRGGMYYLHDLMSVYRAYSSGSWSERMESRPEDKIKHCRDILKMCDCLDNDTAHRYRDDIAHIQSIYKRNLALLERDFSQIKRESSYKKLKFRTRCSLYMACKYPKFHKKMIAVWKTITLQ